MKRCGMMLLGLSLIGWSGDSSFVLKSVIAGDAPQQQQQQLQHGALGENAAAVIRSTPGEAFRVHRTVHADVVAIDQPFVINRLGASQPEGMIFVLKSDLVAKTNNKPLGYDNFKLRNGKRPRPLVLRMNVGDLLEIHFENWLQSVVPPLAMPSPTQQLATQSPFQQKTRDAGIHVNGLDLVPETIGGAEGILSDGSYVGRNASGLLAPRSTAKSGEPHSRTYRLYAKQTGTFLLTSGADTTVHQLDAGLFGAVNVQPQGAEWYRSQTTRAEIQAATLQEGDLRSHEQTLGEYQPPPKLTPDQDMLESDREVTAVKENEEVRSLRTAAPGSRAPVVANVIKDAEGRIYSKLKQPLINYFSVYSEGDRNTCPAAIPGNPILNMLRVEPGGPNAPRVSRTLSEGEASTEAKRLDDGFVTFFLRESFKQQPLSIDLAPESTIGRVAFRNKDSWVVINPGISSLKPGSPVVAGKSYLVQEIHNGGHTLTIEECKLHLVYSDLTAVITGPNAGNFPFNQDAPDFFTNPASPDRREPYREFTIIYHQGGNVVQAFQPWSNNNLIGMINSGMDQFGINYGFAAIGPEIVANRLGVGPMGNGQQPIGASGSNMAPKANQPNDAVELKYEEFFLSSWAVGDPAMVVDVPSNAPNQMVSNPDQGPDIVGPVQADPVQFTSFKGLGGARPTKVFYPDDPSNVYHSYMRDHTKMRVLHAGPGPAHVHHLHAHQWLKSPNSPEATYLDSQLILPGSAYTLEITYNGSGNRNQTVGDSIFHCHFYPHFAKGMWSLWRVHDTFEAGTELNEHGVCVTDKPNRALPDGEIAAGTPIPALIPLPTLGMAPMPAPVQVTDLSAWYGGADPKANGMGRRVEVIPKNWARIVEQFDKDKDGTLSDAERKDWYNAIDSALQANKACNKKYGDVGYRWVPYALYDNPGYPFFIPGVSGHRPPHPPMDTAWKEDGNGQKSVWTDQKIADELHLDPTKAAVKSEEVQYLNGGLPRHLVLGGDIVTQYNTRWDFSKDFVKPVKNGMNVTHVGGLYAFQLPEQGTPVERAAMKAHATRTRATTLPENGDAGNFILNGLPPTPGAPYADPSVTDDGNSSGVDRRYQAAVIQTDVVLNKKGWHYPQSRFITLWEDVAPTIKNDRAPEPFFIRTATNDATVLWHTNLVPSYYELDDFQVRTPTDVIGQHIHLVKFDVTSSDGAANGFNYEDGTFGPKEVQDRIHAISNVGGIFGFDPRTGYVKKDEQNLVAVWPNKYAYPKRGTAGDVEYGLFGKPPAHQDWEGAMTTIQRWAIDPLLNWQGQDRTLRTVFTHDHFGPSTHQQVGLYAGVLVEPQGSQWYLPDGVPMNTRVDGGPTSWQAMIVTADSKASHREYAIEFQDMHLAYTADSTVGPSGSNALFKPKLSREAEAILKKQVSGYDGDNPQAPAAFFLGQSSLAEMRSIPQLIQLLNNTPDGDPIPDIILKDDLFLNYGIPLDKNTQLYKLAKGEAAKGFLRAQWLFVVPSDKKQDGPLINGGDYYILEANNPITVTVGNPPLEATTPGVISVYTPSIPPGFSDPAHAVNPNPGDTVTLSDTAPRLGNLGTPHGDPQPVPPKPAKPNIPPPPENSNISNSKFGNGAPYPSLVSTRANGTYSMNYRNEPVQLRVKSGSPKQTDLAFAFSSIDRDDPQLNVQPKWNDPISKGSPYKFPPPLFPADPTGSPQGTDPFTPLIRGYPGDDIQIRTLVGAHLQPHAFSIHGVDWLSQPSYHDSGYRNVQSMGISEHYEMRFKMPAAAAPRTGSGSPSVGGADYFYSASTGAVGLSNGMWGILRSYTQEVDHLTPLINNSKVPSADPIDFRRRYLDAKAATPAAAREFRVVATTAARALKDGKLIYNTRAEAALKDGTLKYNLPPGQSLDYSDPDAVIFVRESDLDQDGKLKAGVRVEPLILRAAAGDWIKVTLINQFSEDPKEKPFASPFSFRYGNPFNDLPRLPGDTGKDPKPTIGAVDLRISRQVGLHPQLVAFDVTKSNGINVGFNPSSTVGPGKSTDYYWYAGEIIQRDGTTITTPIEFGATNLVAADLILQTQFGLVGALVIEPEGSSWDDDTGSRAFSTVTKSDGHTFRECVLVMQNLVKNLSPGREDRANQTLNRNLGFAAVNYRTENFLARGVNGPPAADLGFGNVFSNSLPFPTSMCPPIGDPETPIFEVTAGTPTRFRVVMPSTTSANSASQPLVFAIHGHGWQDEPYVDRSITIGNNDMAQLIGAQEVTVTQKYDIVIDSAGGPFRVPGDYLYQAFNQEQRMGIWGLFRVKKSTK